MSHKNNDYFELSNEISNEISSIIVNQKKMEIENKKESIIRSNNDNRLLEEMNKRTSEINNKLKDINKRINLIEGKIFENYNLNIDFDENEKENDNLIALKDNDIHKIISKIDETKNLLNLKINEQYNLKNESNETVLKIKDEVNKLANEIDNLNYELKNIQFEKEILLESIFEFDKSKLLEKLEVRQNQVKKDNDLFNNLYEDYKEMYESNIKLLRKFNILNSNLKNLLNTELFNEKLNNIIKKTNLLSNKIDIDNLSMKKIVLSTSELVKNLITLNTKNFSNTDEIYSYENKINNILKQVKENNKLLLDENKKASLYNNDLINLTDEIDYIHKKVIENNETINKLNVAVFDLKDHIINK
tara:strand:- start:574 stop:1656 length:1083 start_codon:yes stop_codon:yes gene_type:complete